MNDLMNWDEIEKQIDIERDFKKLSKMHLEMDVRERIARKARQLEGNNRVANKCAKYRIRIEAVIGEEYERAESGRKGTGSNQHQSRTSTDLTTSSNKQTIEAETDKSRMTLNQYSKQAEVIKENPVLLEEYEAKCNEKGEAVTSKGFMNFSINNKPRESDPIPKIPIGKYQIIYADPPWKYAHTQEFYGQDVEKHYKTLSIEELCSLPIKNMAHDDCVLYMWTTSPFLERSFEVLKAWGFEYKTCLVWDKVKHNMGFYASIRHELLLIGGRGSSKPDDASAANQIDSVYVEERTEHSKKPEYFYNMIEKLHEKKVKRIELFSRNKRKGWDSWGNELIIQNL